MFLLLVACLPQQAPPAQPVQEKIVEKVVVQCWDGSTADSLDKCPPKQEEKNLEATKEVIITSETPVPTVVSGEIAQKLLDNIKSKFTGMAYLLADRIVIKYKNKVRHYFLRMSETENGTPLTDVYLDLDKKTAVGYCNVEREGRDMAGDSFDWGRSKCKDYIDKPIPLDFNKWQSQKGPIEWLEDFAPLKPALVENNLQTISIGGNSKSIQPSLHYMIDGKRVILRIDKRYGVPIKIEFEGDRSVDFRDTYFDTMIIGGKQFRIDESWVEYKPVSEYWLKAPSK